MIWFKYIIVHPNFIHRHRALPTITRTDQCVCVWGYRHTDQNNGSLRIYCVIQIPPFTDCTYSAREECGAMAEITWIANRSSVEWCGSHHPVSRNLLQPPSSEPQLAESVFSYFAYGDTVMWPKLVWHSKMQYLKKKLQWAQPLIIKYDKHFTYITQKHNNLNKFLLCQK